jgi:hypothetical protein
MLSEIFNLVGAVCHMVGDLAGLMLVVMAIKR